MPGFLKEIAQQQAMNAPDHTERIIAQGKALVRTIETLGTIEPSDWFERAMAGLLQAAYITASAGDRGGCAVVGSRGDTERIGDKRAVLWMSNN